MGNCIKLIDVIRVVGLHRPIPEIEIESIIILCIFMMHICCTEVFDQRVILIFTNSFLKISKPKCQSTFVVDQSMHPIKKSIVDYNMAKVLIRK